MELEEPDASPKRFVVEYANAVTDFIIANVWSKQVLERIFAYRHLLEDFPDLGAPYDPEYRSARPPFPCRRIAVPDTPFSLYYMKDDEHRRIQVFYIEHQGADPSHRFSWDSMGM